MPVTSIVEEEREQTPIGVITKVHGPVVVITCDLLPPLRQALCANLDHFAWKYHCRGLFQSPVAA